MRTGRSLAAVAACAGLALAASSATGQETWGQQQTRGQAGTQQYEFDKQGFQLSQLGMDASEADQRDLRDVLGYSRGVLVEHVRPQQAAARAGLRSGDIIVEVEKELIGSAHQLTRALHEAKEAQKGEVELTVARGGETRTLMLDLERPGFGQQIFGTPGPGLGDQEGMLHEELGVVLRDAHRQQLQGTGFTRGLSVERVHDHTTARQVGLRPGDVIVRIDGQPADMNRLHRTLSRASPGQRLNLAVVRQGQEYAVQARLPDWVGRERVFGAGPDAGFRDGFDRFERFDRFESPQQRELLMLRMQIQQNQQQIERLEWQIEQLRRQLGMR